MGLYFFSISIVNISINKIHAALSLRYFRFIIFRMRITQSRSLWLSLFIYLIAVVLFQVNKKSFCTNDGVSITLHAKDLFETETFAFSSLFVQKKNYSKFQPKSLLCLLIIICGDVETCPGPDGSCDETMVYLTGKKGVHIFHQNIRGLLTNFNKIQSFFCLYKNIDILTLSETHILSQGYNDDDSLYQILGYKFIKRNREHGTHDGVAMYISEKLIWKRRHDLERDEIEGMIIECFQKNAKSFLVGSFYRPPDGSQYLHKNFNKIFQEMLTVINKTFLETIILGDLNANYNKRNICKELKDIITVHGYNQLINTPTRITKESSTLIDIILTNNQSVISATGIAPLNLSDHDLIGCVRKMNHMKYQYKTITCRNYSKYDPEKMRMDLQSQNMNELYTISDVNSAVEMFEAYFDYHL